MEPIHGGTVDDSGEHSCSESESITDWGEAEGKMEVLSDLVEEELEELVWSVLVAGTLGFSSDLSEEAIKLILGEELWDPTG
jgi:hypothetical protein